MESIMVKHTIVLVGVLIIMISQTKGQYPITCGEEICGYGTRCLGSQCKCSVGFNDVVGTTVKVCYKSCSGENDSSCKDNTTCEVVTAISSYRCLCSEGYTRSSQTEECIDKNECVENPPICKPDLECVNTVGSYRCVNATVTDDSGEREQSTESMSTPNSIQTSPYTTTGPWSTASHSLNMAPSSSNIPEDANHPDNPGEDKGDNMKLTIGLAAGIGGAVLILVLIIVIILIIRRKRHTKSPATIESPQLREEGGRVNNALSPSIHHYHSVTNLQISLQNGTDNHSGLRVVNTSPVQVGFNLYEETDPTTASFSQEIISPYGTSAGVVMPAQPNSPTSVDGLPTKDSADKNVPIGLYSNHKIPEVKAKQRQDKELNDEDNPANPYNTLYDESLKPSVCKAGSIEPGNDLHDPEVTNEYDTTYNLSSSGKGSTPQANFAVVDGQKSADVLYDELNLPKV